MRAMRKYIWLGLGIVGASGAYADTSKACAKWLTLEFNRPGSGCNTFGAPGVAPNGGPTLTNFNSSGSPMLVECPFTLDAADPGSVIDAHVDTGTSGPTSCVLWQQQRNQTGWGWFQSSVTTPGGYNELNWGQTGVGGNADITAGSIECKLSPGQSIQSYRVSTAYCNWN